MESVCTGKQFKRSMHSPTKVLSPYLSNNKTLHLIFNSIKPTSSESQNVLDPQSLGLDKIASDFILVAVGAGYV